MSYPVDVPSAKHDLVGPRFLRSELIEYDGPAKYTYDSTSRVFEGLEASKVPRGDKLAAVYTYPDGPKVPAPLSRVLFIIGFADRSVSLVRKLISDDVNPPPCLHKCTVGVKLADADHASKLKEQDVSNSNQFAKLMRMLREKGMVAILGCDKHERCGMLSPLSSEAVSSSDYTSQDFAGFYYVGKMNELKDYLTSSSQAEPVSESAAELWQPPATETEETNGFEPPQPQEGLWQPPTIDEPESYGESSSGFETAWEPSSVDQNAGEKRKRADSEDDKFHADEGAAAADKFYSGLRRDLGTRADSRLYHMRSFNGWVKATQIQELNPKTKRGKQKPGVGPLRVLDLACGKGGDLGKWILHKRGISNYVGIDVARGSLLDAALRARKMRNKMDRCTFTVADLGADVPGRPKTPKHKRLQKLLSWSLQAEYEYETADPEFQNVEGGGISADDKFDVVSIQFAIHYMMSSQKRARRFFQTVSQLLEIGGNLIATTIDARVVLERMMNMRVDLHQSSNEGSARTEDEEDVVITAGGGACRIQFSKATVKRIFQPKSQKDDVNDLFGLQYTFTLVEGSDHAAGVGDAVNLPEWLTPLPVLKSLASEAGLELEYALNFHEFYHARQDPSIFGAAHEALYNMKVVNRRGTISDDEWDVSRLYAALKFRKVRESRITIEDEEEEEEEEKVAPPEAKKHVPAPSADTSKLLPIAMLKVKRSVGEGKWQELSSEEKKRLMNLELAKIS